MNDFTFENPPFAEARCFFLFGGGEPWDWTIPGRFWSKIEKDYPLRAKKRGTSVNDPEETTEDGDPLIFRNTNGNLAVYVGPDGISLNAVQPYVGWLRFKQEILNVLDSYWAVARPEFVQNVSLTYINRLETPSEPFHYDQFLNAHVVLPKGRRDLGWINWAQRVDMWNEDLESLVTIRSGTSRPFSEEANAEDVRKVVLEIQVDHYFQGPMQKDAVSNWIESAHNEIKSTFLDSLTDLSKKSIGFKEENATDI